MTQASRACQDLANHGGPTSHRTPTSLARPSIRALMVVAALCSSLTVGVGPALGQEAPAVFRAFADDDSIEGFNFAANDFVALEIFDAPGGTSQFSGSFPTEADGHFQGFGEDTGVNLMVGSHLTVSQGSTTKALTLVAITWDVLDLEADTASGTAPPLAEVTVEVFGESDGFQLTVTADGSGDWFADFGAEDFDVTFDMGGIAQVDDGDGDASATGAPQLPQPPVFEVSITPEASSGADTIFACCGEGFTPDSSVTVEIFDSPGGTSLFGPTSVPTDFEGSFLIDPETHGLDLVAGMHVVVTDNTTSVVKELTLADITFDVLDADTDTASGTAPVGAEVHVDAVGLGSSFCCVVAVADGSGNWVADFGAEGFDITPGMGGTVHLEDADRDTTRAGIPCFCPAFEVSISPEPFLEEETVFSCCESGFTPNDSVTIEIFDVPGGTSLFEGTVLTDSEGGFNAGPWIHHLNLEAGMHVVVTDDTTAIAKELTLADLTFDALDPITDTASGTAPPNVSLFVEVGGDDGSFGVDVTADGGGTWSVDLAAEGFDVTPNMGGTVHLGDEDGDATRAGFLPVENECGGIGIRMFGGGTYEISDAQSFILATGDAELTQAKVQEFLDVTEIAFTLDGLPQTFDIVFTSFFFEGLGILPGVDFRVRHAPLPAGEYLTTVSITFEEDFDAGPPFGVISAGTVIGASRTIVVTPQAEFPSGEHSTCSPSAELQDVANDLQQIVDDNPGTRMARTAQKVLDKVNISLAELAEDPPDRTAASSAILGAVKDLQAAVSSGVIPQADGVPLLESLATASRALTEEALEAAILRVGNATKIQGAEKLLAQGDALKQGGQYVKAVTKYRDALAQAQNA